MLSEAWSDFRYRLRALFRRDALERELDEELRFHVEREAAAYERAGVPHDEAVRRARVAFGGIEQTKEASRDSRGTARIESVIQDLRYAARSLRHRPGFTLAVVLTLGLGIGANTAIFTLVDALMLRTLPVPHAEQLVSIGDPAAVNGGWHGSPQEDYQSYPVYADVRDGNTVLTDMYASGRTSDFDVNFDQNNQRVVEHPRIRLVTSNFFAVLGVSTYAGRSFAPDADRLHRSDADVVIGYDYWQRRFSGDRSVLGRIIRVNDVPMEIVGIAAPGFTGDVVGETTELWLPMMMQPMLNPRTNLVADRDWSWLQMMGRLKPGVTLAQARAQLAALTAQSIRGHVTGIELKRFEQDLKDDPIRVEAAARGFSSRREQYGRALVVLMIAVGVVILVVCANVSNLMLARAAARGREMTVRMTLGASRSRLVQQLLTESAMLAALAAVCGILVATWGSRLLISLAGSGTQRIALDVSPDARVLAFAGAMTIVCVIFFGLTPAFRATRVDLAPALRGQGRSVVGGAARPGGIPVTKLLVVAQITLSTLLLMGSGLLVRSMQQLMHADLGFDRDHLLAVRVGTFRSNYVGARLAALRQDLAERVSHVHGVESATYTVEGVFGGSSGGHVSVPGFVPQADSERQVDYDQVGPSYFRSIGAHILRGRDFERRDLETDAKVGAINQTMAAAYFRERDPIGRTVTLDDDTFTIVAVVADVQEHDVRGKPVRRLYMAMNEATPKPQSFELEARVPDDPARYVASVRDAVLAADRTLKLEIEPITARVRQSVSVDLLLTQVTAFFGALTLLLAALGLYGVTAYATAQRTNEFGVRLALGAKPELVAGMVVREATTLVIVGLALGIPIGLVAVRFVRAQLFGVGIVDVPSLSVSVAVLIVTAVVASYLPARRAARVDPLEALRAE
ncbi:MAG TPA: ABC transporter permease [Gemmatimonadaceae bacterium]|nr:ABC transporter permease [Gemmatimonadaceae bacterium]